MSGEERPRKTPKAAPRAAFAESVRTRSQWAAGEAVHHQFWIECANMRRTLPHQQQVERPLRTALRLRVRGQRGGDGAAGPDVRAGSGADGPGVARCLSLPTAGRCRSWWTSRPGG
ncbi:hypothetical protein GCM10010247_04770 [Streptomyces calvus]|nr:hypothetical protein GCM10010247_04770 [Streptomyces calvus]